MVKWVKKLKDAEESDGLREPPTRSSSREVRIRVPFLFSVVHFSRGTLPKKRGEKGTTGGPSQGMDLLRLRHL